MNINDLLAGIDIEILKMNAQNSMREDAIKRKQYASTLEKIEKAFNIVKKNIIALDSQLGFIKKMELKKELKAVLKQIQDKNVDEELRLLKTSQILTKMSYKYKLKEDNTLTEENSEKEVVTKKEAVTKEEERQSFPENREEFNPGFQERIEAAFKRAEEQRKEKGITAEEPVATFDTDEIKEAAERRARIEQAIKKKQELALEEAERKARINLAFEKKKAKSKVKTIQPKEEFKHESVMDRRIREMMENYERSDTDADSNLKKKISIRYELQNDAYYVDGEVVMQNPKKLLSLAEKEAYIKSQMKRPSEFGYIFDKFKPEEVKALRYCDPYIVGILAARNSILARDYVKQLAGTSQKKLSPIDFEVVYDARGLESMPADTVSRKEKSQIRKTIKHSRKTVKVLEDKRKLPWYATIPVVGALAIGTISGATAAFNQNNQNNDEDLSSKNSYSDTIEPGTISDDEIDTTEAANLSTQDISSLATTTATVEIAEITTTTVATIEASEKETETTTTPAEANQQSEKDTNKPATNPDEEKEQAVIVNIGDKISVQEGIRYTADCLGGGTSNKIGAVSWRPAAEYSVDKVAFVYGGKVLGIMNAGDVDVEQALNSIAEKNGIEVNQISTSVLLSLVPGIGDTGWAQISIDDMQQNVFKPVQEASNSAISHIDFDFDR